MDTNSNLIIVIIAILALIIFYTIGVFNKLINSKNIVNDKWSEIDKQLKRKVDLIPKLIEIVKQYTTSEETSIMMLLTNRNKIVNAFSINDKIDANDRLTKSLEELIELKKNYKKLASDNKFINLVNELKEIDEKIMYAKEFYNEAAEKHNNKINKFPTNLIAISFNFKQYELFKQ